MSGNEELLSAFNSLADSVRDVSLGVSIRDAQKQVDAVRQNQDLNDLEKIKQQQAIAQQAGANIISRGGNAFLAQQAMASLAPHIPDEQMRQMESTGKDTFAEAQQALHDRALKEEKEKEARDLQGKKELEAMKVDAML